MKKLALFMSLQLLSWSVFGQEKSSNPKRIQYVDVPRERVIIVVVNQPDSPVKIEDATCLFRMDKRKTIIRYRARNVSSKPIATFTVISWDLGGAGGTLPVLLWGAAPLMHPGTALDSMSSGEDYEILPLTEKLRDKLKQDSRVLFEGKVQVYFLLIDQVHFADGSVYKDQRVSQALRDYLSEHTCNSDP